jgi:hypothetical protein
MPPSSSDNLTSYPTGQKNKEGTVLLLPDRPPEPLGFSLPPSLQGSTASCHTLRSPNIFHLVLCPESLHPLPTIPTSFGEPPSHSSLEALDFAFSPFSHITDLHLSGAPDRFIDWSSHKAYPHQAGYAIIEGFHNDQDCVPPQWVIEAKTLPLRTLSQQAELIALTQGLELAKDNITNIYTDFIQHYSLQCYNLERERIPNPVRNPHYKWRLN